MTAPAPDDDAGLSLGIQENLTQFVHQLIQVLLVGFALGMMRTVVPALAETEFGVAKGSFLLLTAFVVAFGVVKGVLNFVAGRLSERIGRKRVLLLGWIAAVPIPVMIYLRPKLGLDRRGHSAPWRQSGALLVDDPDVQAGFHAG